MTIYMLLKHFSWAYTMKYNSSPDSPTLMFTMLCFPAGRYLCCLFVLNYQVSMFKPILHIHETMLLHEFLTWLEKHPTVSLPAPH